MGNEGREVTLTYKHGCCRLGLRELWGRCDQGAQGARTLISLYLYPFTFSFLSPNTPALSEWESTARWLERTDVRDHRWLSLSSRPLPPQWGSLPQRAGGFLGPLWDAKLQGKAVPAEARGVQGEISRLGGNECQVGSLRRVMDFYWSFKFSLFSFRI